MIRTITQVFAVQADVVIVQEAADALKQFTVQRGRAAERQGQAMRRDGVTFGELVETGFQGAAEADSVLGSNLEEIDRAVLEAEELVEDIAAQAQA